MMSDTMDDFTCDTCPFKIACPFREEGKQRCEVGSHPLRYYSVMWGVLIALSLLIH